MSPSVAMHTVQIISGLLWLIPLFLFRAPIARAWRGKALLSDWVVLPYPIVGAVQFGFTMRWVIFPAPFAQMSHPELLFWGALYSLSGITVALVIFAWRAWGLR